MRGLVGKARIRSTISPGDSLSEGDSLSWGLWACGRLILPAARGGGRGRRSRRLATDSAGGVMSSIAGRAVRPAIEPVDPAATAQIVNARSPEQPVVPRPTIEQIGLGVTDQHVIAGTAS